MHSTSCRHMRGWRGYFGFCQTPEVLIALSLAGSGCDCVPLSGANGKHHGVAARLLSQMGSRNGLQGTRPAAAVVHGILPAAKPSPLGFPMRTSDRSVSHPCSARVSATSRTAVYGPVRTVVWEGGAARLPSIPIFDPIRSRVEKTRCSAARCRATRGTGLLVFNRVTISLP
jgi:hypothetical protein